MVLNYVAGKVSHYWTRQMTVTTCCYTKVHQLFLARMSQCIYMLLLLSLR